MDPDHNTILLENRFTSRCTGTEVSYRVLYPAGHDPAAAAPLILHLHGAMSSSVSLANARDAYGAAWASGRLPPAIVACASTPTSGGFYIDHAGGAQWERCVSEELPEVLGARFVLDGRRAILGFSMGGYGALKIALRHPERYAAVAALCPVIFPAETPDSVPARNRPGIIGELHAAMGGDAAAYRHNDVHALARAHRDALRESGQRIYVDCGTEDEFALHDGAAYFHGVLRELGIAHTYVPVPGARHADEHAPRRQQQAIDFLGQALLSQR